MKAINPSMPKTIIARLSVNMFPCISTLILDDENDLLSDAVTVIVYIPGLAQV